MLTFSDTQRNRYGKQLFAASSVLLLLSLQALAQSGRRTPRPIATPTTSTEQPPVPATSVRRLAERAVLIVATQPTSKHLLSEEAISASMLKRLNELPNVTALDAGD